MSAFHQALPGMGWVSLVPSGTNPTAIHLAEVEDGDWNIKQETADLEDSDGNVIDSFVTKEDISGKLSLRGLSNSLIAAIARGTTLTDGSLIGATYTTTIPTTPFEVTVTPPNSGVFAMDLGVFNVSNKRLMTCGATATGTNVFAVNASTGKYTFNTADAGDTIEIAYRFTASTTGTTVEIAKALAGAVQPKFQIHVYKSTVSGKEWGFYVPAAVIPGLSGSFKKKDWSTVSVDWKALLSDTGKKFYAYGPT